MQRPVESMILTCPACTTRYLVEPAALGADGRRVRCARCQHTWHAEPLEEEPPAPQLVEDEAAPADAPTPEPHVDAEQDDDIDEAESANHNTGNETGDIEEGNEEQAGAFPPKREKSRSKRDPLRDPLFQIVQPSKHLQDRKSGGTQTRGAQTRAKMRAALSKDGA